MTTLPAARVMKNQLMDSTVWEDFRFRFDDIVIATYAKTGTTWMQQIIGQILLGPDADLRVHDLSPWLDLRLLPTPEILDALEAQSHRRFIKTHLPVQALTMSEHARYVYVARDGRDTCWSLHNHQLHLKPDRLAAINNLPGRVGPPFEQPPADPLQFFREWLHGDGYPFWPFFEHIRGWWQIRQRPNVMLVHFSELKRDLAGTMREIAGFIGTDVDAAHWPEINRYCSFGWMKANAARVTPFEGDAWDGGGQTFINRGTNGRWRDVLTSDDVAAYEARAAAELGADCAAWLAQP